MVTSYLGSRVVVLDIGEAVRLAYRSLPYLEVDYDDVSGEWMRVRCADTTLSALSTREAPRRGGARHGKCSSPSRVRP
jgi:hypothetical protein